MFFKTFCVLKMLYLNIKYIIILTYILFIFRKYTIKTGIFAEILINKLINYD